MNCKSASKQTTCLAPSSASARSSSTKRFRAVLLLRAQPSTGTRIVEPPREAPTVLFHTAVNICTGLLPPINTVDRVPRHALLRCNRFMQQRMQFQSRTCTRYETAILVQNTRTVANHFPTRTILRYCF